MSQFDEDQIIPTLFSFCEFGAADGIRLSNTALLYEAGWIGTYIEPSSDFEKLLINRPNATCLKAFITAENVNELVPDVDVLSIDIDGNDYWVWKAYEGRPKVVIVESNLRMMEGVHPYDSEFRLQSKKDPYGASPDALRELASEKGYTEVCMTGVNLIFQCNA